MSILSEDSDARGGARGLRLSASSLCPQRQLFLVAMAAPALIYVLAVAVGPMVQGFLYSFDNYSLIRPASRHFVGLDNYLGCGAIRLRVAH